MRFRLCITAALASVPAHLWAIAPQEVEFFEKKVRPVLADHCVKCHGPEKQKAELRLDSKAGVLKGSDGGPIAVAGKPDESSLIKSIRHQGDSKMPAKEPKLPDEQIEALTEWVRMGMPWPEGDAPKASSQQIAAADHWSFKPVKKPEPPAVKDGTHWVQSPIDRFVLAKLEAAGLQPNPIADKRTLIRRATFDLTGLPPTAAEVEAFEKDLSPDAFAKVVDRLLASPRYGERWGRYWLDVARYADTKGYVFQEERRYPYAYTYRDWVIQALNADLPYDQFLIQQIAADQVAPKDDPRPLAAMGFLTLGRRFLNNQADIIDDRIDVLARGTMGLTIGCARCHDHKFDPITQKDYYALYGVFASSVEPKDSPSLPDSRDAQTKAEYDKLFKEKQGEVDAYLTSKQAERSLLYSLSLYTPVVAPQSVVAKSFNRAERDHLNNLRKKVDELNAGPLAAPHPMALADAPQPVKPHVFIRGNPGRPGEEVPRRFLTVLSNGNPKPFEKGSGRLELAQAIASKDNPLTPRVIVNRVWANHFARGLVRTPGDFGVKGEPPTHPELLDWLASQLIEDGWSLKKLHRRMMLSSAYQQISDVNPKAAQADPDNRLLSRMNRRRLDFESMRDSLLCAANQLDLTMGGRAVDLTNAPFTKRRAVYGFIDRQNLPGTFRTFDFASPDTTSPQRHVTTVPQQALFMMNSPFVVEQAKALAQRQASGNDPREEDIHAVYQQVFARRAEPSEVQAALRFLTAQANRPPEESETPIWQYGYGGVDEEKKRVDFHPLPHWTGKMWQGGKKAPDPVLHFVTLNSEGGHPGIDAAHAAIRRWTAPQDGVYAVAGSLVRPSENGDGVLGRVVSSRQGEVGEFTCDPKGSVQTKVDRVELRKGDTLDFLVECRTSDNSDSFQWTPVIRREGGGEWDSKAAFSGPPEKRDSLSPWEKYAQVLLASNEFVFVD